MAYNFFVFGVFDGQAVGPHFIGQYADKAACDKAWIALIGDDGMMHYAGVALNNFRGRAVSTESGDRQTLAVIHYPAKGTTR